MLIYHTLSIEPSLTPFHLLSHHVHTYLHTYSATYIHTYPYTLAHAYPCPHIHTYTPSLFRSSRSSLGMLETELLQHVFAPLTAALHSKSRYPIPMISPPEGTPHHTQVMTSDLTNNTTPSNNTIPSSGIPPYTTTPSSSSANPGDVTAPGTGTGTTPSNDTTPSRGGNGNDLELSDSILDMLHEEISLQLHLMMMNELFGEEEEVTTNIDKETVDRRIVGYLSNHHNSLITKLSTARDDFLRLVAQNQANQRRAAQSSS